MAADVPHIIVASHAWYGDTTGGSFRLASEFAEYLATAGNIVSFVCCAKDADHQFPDCETVRGVRVFRYRPSSRPLSGMGRLRFHVNQSRLVCDQIAARQPIAALSGHSPLQALGAAMALRGRKTFINYTIHSPFDDELRSNVAISARFRIVPNLAAMAAHWVDRKNCKIADRVQTVSHYTLKSMIQKHGRIVSRKGVVAPGWVDAERFRPAENRQVLRVSLGPEWQTDAPILFTLRRLENRMGLDTLINACEIVAKRGVRFRMLIGGGGSLHGRLQQLIDSARLHEQVCLLGRVPEEQVTSCYAAADCFVLPTRSLECFGLIVLEAFSCNTPVIASAVAAIPELAERQGSEWMFEPGDATQLATRICDFVGKRLQPTADLRSVALEFDKTKVLPTWKALLCGSYATP